MEHKKSNAAKFAFFYMLSLVALIFMALSSGMIIFQIINKLIADPINQFSGRFSTEALKFAISAIIIATPIYFLITRQIFKNLFSGELDENSGIRKWLTYFILLVSSVVMIGWFIATINSFLDGELTSKFILKSLTAIGIAAIVFSFYFYDIKREGVKEKKDKIIRLYFVASLVAVIAVFISSLFFVESPGETRDRKMDEKVLSQFNKIDGAVNQYFKIHEDLPENFKVLQGEFEYLVDKDFVNPFTNKTFDYNLKSTTTYELCDTFLASNIEEETEDYREYKELWPHGAGYQCLDKTIIKNGKEIINRIPGEEPIIIR
jgi:hypothetical protein